MDYFPTSKYRLVLFGAGTTYYQSYQDSSIEFSLCRKEGDIYVQTFDFVTCRELLCKALEYSLCPDVKISDCDTFRFSDLSNVTAMSIYLDDDDAYNLSRNLKLLTALEEHLNIEPTQIYDCSDNNYLVLLSPYWLKAGLTLSIYSFLLRLLTYCTYFSTMQELFDEISYHVVDEIGSDMSRLEYFKENVDILLLLENIDTVLGDSPITGINDEEFIRKAINCDTSTDFILHHKDNKNEELQFWLSNAEDYNGFNTFTKSVSTLREEEEAGSEIYLGCLGNPFELWAYNYVLLTQGKI